MTLGHRINNHGHSIGIALGACTVPAAGKPSFTLAENEMEFGVGIHGEPGIARRPFTTLNAAVDDMFHTLIDHGHYQRTIRVWDRQQGEWRDEMQTKQPLTRGDRAIALVNNLAPRRCPSCMAYTIDWRNAAPRPALLSNATWWALIAPRSICRACPSRC